jgi:hypothetical protein
VQDGLSNSRAGLNRKLARDVIEFAGEVGRRLAKGSFGGGGVRVTDITVS